jgi:ABC-type dipeptide/oligopeptide/nickel transport system permease component
LAHAAPGDAASNYVHRVQANPSPTEEDLVAARHDLGLDRPFLLQYGTWARGALSGRLGLSYATRGPVAGEIARTVPLTMELTALAAAIALLVAVPAGVVSAVLRGGPFDHAARLISIGVASFPSFWLALVLIDIVAVRLRLLPTGGREGWTSLVLPTIVLAAAPAARLARFTRAVILESIEEPYVTAARAKGLTEWRVVLSRALRPALGPLVTAFSLSIGFLLSGAVIVESIFNLPGVGRLSLDAIRQGDYPMIQGVVLYGGVTFAILNLLVDLSYSVIDARVGTAGTAAF